LPKRKATRRPSSISSPRFATNTQNGQRGARRDQNQAESEQTAAQLSSAPIAYDTGFTLPPGKYTLKFLARENETGKMGTYETKFTSPTSRPPAAL
jgi:hypothetical protein